MTIDLLFEICARLTLVAFAAFVAGLSLHRLILSRSRNRVLYGPSMVASGTLAVVCLSDLLLSAPQDPVIAMGCIASPFVWGLVCWVASSGRLNADDPQGGLDDWPLRADIAHSTNTTQEAATPVPIKRDFQGSLVFSTRQRVHKPVWRAPMTLEDHQKADG